MQVLHDDIRDALEAYAAAVESPLKYTPKEQDADTV